MKLRTKSLAALAAFTLAGHASAATLLFSDNFTATSPGAPNDQTTNAGRQGGTLANLGYLQAGNVQIGNSTNAAPNGGNDMLIAFGGSAYVNYNFSAVTVPLEISFTGLVNSANGSTTDDWVSFSVGDNTVDWVTSAAASILFRASGETQLFVRGGAITGDTGYAPGLDAWTSYKVVLSDTVGTGSAWGTGGSRADYYSNGVFMGTATLSQLTADEGYIGFSGNAQINGYDNLSVTAIPEPTAALLGSLGILALLRRRR